MLELVVDDLAKEGKNALPLTQVTRRKYAPAVDG